MLQDYPDSRRPAGDATRNQLGELIERYSRARDGFVKVNSSYNEAQLRNDFINPFLKILGWDVDNEAGRPQAVRDVLQETTVTVQDEEALRDKNPDYELRRGGRRVLYWESKKPSVPILTHGPSAFQLRRYGWSAGLTASVLTNFEHLIVYDTRFPVAATDGPQAGRRITYSYNDYLARFDELHALLSREAVYAGSIENTFPEANDPGIEPFDSRFLSLIEGWRERLASALVEENPGKGLGSRSVNALVQRLINRIIFLRICEARQLEAYENLKHVQTYEQLKTLFQEADRRYNSSLFAFARDRLSLDVSVTSDILVDIFKDLYMPSSPYSFSVVDPALLGEIYEAYLGREVSVNGNRTEIVDVPEVAAASGVVVTPHEVAAKIVQETLDPLVMGRSPTELAQFRVIDLSCGSGTFLLAAFSYLLNYHLNWYVTHGYTASDLVFERTAGDYRLTLAEKARVLIGSIHGVDIDPQAAEVTRFSLLLKLIEGETSETIAAAAQHGAGALPDLNRNIVHGNSLVDDRFYTYMPSAATDTALVERVVPINLATTFPAADAAGGFSAVVGNPPYVRIQNMSAYSPTELDYYRSNEAPYTTITHGNIDKYFLFLERGLELLEPDGRLGFIVQNRFFYVKAGKSLRRLLATGKHISSIAHFGTQQVFPGRATYVTAITLNRKPTDSFQVEQVRDVRAWTNSQHVAAVTYNHSEVGEDPWVFVSARARSVFTRLQDRGGVRLDLLAHIFVGLQTSKDEVYIQKYDDAAAAFDPSSGRFKGVTATFSKLGNEWEIETSLLVPCMLDAHLGQFEQARPNAAMLFPYEPGTNQPIPEHRMRRDFPLAWAYLEANEDALRGRSLQGDQPEWYRFGRAQSLTRFNGQPNLIWSTLARDAPYAIDDGLNIRFTGGGNGPYYGLRTKDASRISNQYILGVLSHPVIEALVKSRAVSFRGDYYSHGKQFISSIPIISPDDRQLVRRVEDTVRALVEVATSLTHYPLEARRETALKSQSAALRRQLIDAVNEVYGFSDEDIADVSGENLMTPTSDEA